MNKEQLIEACQAVVDGGGEAKEMREVVERFVSDPVQAVKAIGEPERGGVQKIHVADDLTIINVIWAPRMTLRPHNHNMWAVIGVYGGRKVVVPVCGIGCPSASERIARPLILLSFP